MMYIVSFTSEAQKTPLGGTSPNLGEVLKFTSLNRRIPWTA